MLSRMLGKARECFTPTIQDRLVVLLLRGKQDLRLTANLTHSNDAVEPIEILSVRIVSKESVNF